jgi:hypothetical protein
VNHDDGELDVGEHMPRDPAKDHLTQAAVGVGAHDQQIGALLPSFHEKDFAGAAATRRYLLDLRLHAAPGEMAAEIVR